jgi:calpain-15
VDDYFPCYKGTNKTMFDHPATSEIWALVAEKVWGKFYGNYCVCESGVTSDAQIRLTGAPSQYITIDDVDADKMWQDLKNYDQQKYIMCTGSRGDSNGIVAGHAYSLLGAYETPKYKLVKLRNPWGKGEWKGDFSDESPLWTPEMKDMVQYVKADDGVFCMTYEDYRATYSNYCVCYYKDDYVYNYIASQGGRKAEYYEFTINQTTTLNLTLHQRDNRKFPDYDYSRCNFMLFKQEGEQLISKANWRGAKFDKRDAVWIDNNAFMTLEAGTYLVRAKVAWKDKKPFEYAISSYADFPVVLSRRNGMQNFLERLILNIGPEGKMQDMGQGVKFGTITPCYMYKFFYFEHTGSQYTLNIKFTLTLTGMKAGKLNRKDETTLVFSVPPGSKRCGYLKAISDSYSMSYKTVASFA